MISFQFSQWLSYSNPHIKILYAWNWLHCDCRSFCAAHFLLLASKLMLLCRKEVGLLILSLAWSIPRRWSPLLPQSLLSAQWRQELQLRWYFLFCLLFFPVTSLLRFVRNCRICSEIDFFMHTTFLVMFWTYLSSSSAVLQVSFFPFFCVVT